jgi:hypothetical protein
MRIGVLSLPKAGVRISQLWVLFSVACAAAFAIVAFRRGQDVSFDQLNYHTYSAYAFLGGRFQIDAAPAQIIHSYFNPLANLPYYLLSTWLGPRAATVGIAALQSINLVVVTFICATVCRGGARLQRAMYVAAGALIGVASPMALSEIGTSFTDTLTSIPVLTAVALLVSSSVPGIARLLACGALTGCAIALKLTNASFAVGLLAACLLCGPGLRARLHAVGAAVSGLVLGFLMVGGPWGLKLWMQFRNPVFPFYNGVFKSPDSRANWNIITGYLPSGVLDGIAYPFRWAFGIVQNQEQHFVDIRFAVILVVLGLGILGALGLPAAWRGTEVQDNQAKMRLCVFWCASLVAWLAEFSVQRYLVTLELLCGPVALVAIMWVSRGWLGVAFASIFACAASATVAYTDWGHVAYLPPRYGLKVPASLRDDGLFFIANQVISYVIPAFSDKARYFGIVEWEDTAASANTTITRRILKAVHEAGARKIRVVANGPLSLATRIRLGSYGLQPKGTCTELAGFSPTNGIFVCELVRVDDNAPAALLVVPGETVDFSQIDTAFWALSSNGIPDVFNPDWQLNGPIPIFGNGHYPTLFFRLSPQFGQVGIRLLLTFQPLAGVRSDSAGVSLLVNGVHARHVLPDEITPTGDVRYAACVTPTAIAPDRFVNIAFDTGNLLPADGAQQGRYVRLRSLAFAVAGNTDCR